MSLQIWTNYKGSRDGDHFTESAAVLFVPTAIGAQGYDAVKQLLARAYDKRHVDIKEKVLFSTVSNNALVEETETKITLMTGECGWLIPGIVAHQQSEIVIPMVRLTTCDVMRERWH
jgi:hypothetical protein